jgi:hypothetical protein
MHLRTITWLLLLSLNVAFGEQKQDNIGWQPWSDAVFLPSHKATAAESVAPAEVPMTWTIQPRLRQRRAARMVTCSIILPGSVRSYRRR